MFISITFVLDAVKGMVKSECIASGHLLQKELSSDGGLQGSQEARKPKLLPWPRVLWEPGLAESSSLVCWKVTASPGRLRALDWVESTVKDGAQGQGQGVGS